MTSTQAERTGLHPALAARLTAVIQADLSAGLYDGLAIRVGRAGRVMVDLVFGHADRQADRPLRDDTVFSVMSLTKPMTALAIFQAVEKGKLALNTRVADVIPEFARNGKQRVTIAQLLSHTGGMPFLVANLPPQAIGNLRATVEAICEIALNSRPGESVSYSARVSYDVLGEIVTRLDNARPFRTIIEDDILKPLGMHSTAIGARPDLQQRRAPVVARAATEMNLQLAARDAQLRPDSELPGGGGFSTVDDMYRFMEMLRANGTLDGTTIVSRSTLELARSNQTGRLPNNTLAAQIEARGWEPFPAFLGLGFFLRGDGLGFPAPFGSLASPTTYGSIGAGSAVAWVDPRSDLSFVCLTTGLMDQVDSHLRFQRLADIVHGCVID